jgi:hypothetical protein
LAVAVVPWAALLHVLVGSTSTPELETQALTNYSLKPKT